MKKTFWIHVALFSYFLILMVASRRGGGGGGGRGGGGGTGGGTGGINKGGGSNFGSNRNPSHRGNTGKNLDPSHTGNTEGNKNPSHTGNTGNSWNPHNPINPRSNWNPGSSWGNNYNPGGNNYNKQFNPPKTKTNMKTVAGAAIAGGVGGFMLGNANGNMRYHFDNDNDYRYYNSYRNQMPSRVYRPMYQDSYVTEDRFVADCYNMSTTEYVIKPNEGKNITDLDQTEVRVKSTILRQLCVSEYKRGPEYYSGNSGVNLLFSPSLILFITLYLYFVVE